MTFKIFAFKAFPIFLSSALLISCGGGGSPDQSVGNTITVPINTVATPTLGDCFAWTPGVKYVKNDGYKTLMVQEQFEGQTAISDMELRPNDTRFGGAYIVVDSNFVTVLGVIDYDMAGVYTGKDVYTNYRLPVNMAVGQTVQVNYNSSSTRLNPPSATSSIRTTSFKFEGFETVALGGKTFENVCKLRSPSAVAGLTAVDWIAKGFGVIKQENQDANGAAVSGTLRQLVTIVAGS